MPLSLRKSILKRWGDLIWGRHIRIFKLEGILRLPAHCSFVDRQFGILGHFKRYQCAVLLLRRRAQADFFFDIGTNCGLYKVDVVYKAQIDSDFYFKKAA